MDLIEEIQACDIKYMIIENPTTNFNWESGNKLAKDFVSRLLRHHD